MFAPAARDEHPLRHRMAVPPTGGVGTFSQYIYVAEIHTYIRGVGTVN